MQLVGTKGPVQQVIRQAVDELLMYVPGTFLHLSRTAPRRPPCIITHGTLVLQTSCHTLLPQVIYPKAG